MLTTQRPASQATGRLASLDSTMLFEAVVAAGGRAARRRAAANQRRLTKLQQHQEEQQKQQQVNSSEQSNHSADRQEASTLMRTEQTSTISDNLRRPELVDDDRAKRSNRRQRHLSAGETRSSDQQANPVEGSGASSQDESPSELARGQHLDGKDASRRDEEKREESASEKKPTGRFEAELVWKNIILFLILHSCLPVGVYLLYTQRPWRTLLFSIVGMYASGLGVTGGAHRLWSHRSYKAKWPVQVALVCLQTMAGQNSVYTWCRDHRVHHKFAETEADPHNIKRGFFFAHMGWLCCKKHPAVKEKGKLIDMSDLEANSIVMFQHRHFWWMAIVFTVLVPTMVPILLWGERFWTAFVFSFMIRYLITLHGTWLVNSAAHYYGTKPYDVNIEAVESPYAIYNGLGEGFHNYHHTFPYDYATSEFGKYFNITTAFIDFCASLGLVVDRRKVDQETIIKRRLRTGDLTEEKLAEMRKKAETSKCASGSRNYETIKEEKEPNGDGSVSSAAAPLLNNIIHELPYISGLTSMKYTM